MTELELAKLVEAWQDRLGLSHWEITFEIAPMDGCAYASVERHSHYNRAVITFQPWLLTDDTPPAEMISVEITDAFRERVVVHELLHCWTRDYRMLLEDIVQKQLHPDAYALLEQSVEGVEERAVDGLARSLVASFGCA